ncbi:MAG: hypothetical protein ACSLFI_06410 [Solirubrobacterales bacterium]
MIVLLGISSVIAVIVPEPEQETSQEEKVVATGTTGTTGSTGETADQEAEPHSFELVEAEITPDETEQTVEARPGDRLVLTVNPGRNADVEIPDLGLIGTATEYAPVVFDVRLPADPGSYDVLEIGGDKLAAIDTAEKSGPEPKPAKLE